MQLTSTKYEVLYDNNEGWQDISEIKAMDKISDWYDQISPVLQDLFRGKEISTRNDPGIALGIIESGVDGSII